MALLRPSHDRRVGSDVTIDLDRNVKGIRSAVVAGAFLPGAWGDDDPPGGIDVRWLPIVLLVLSAALLPARAPGQELSPGDRIRVSTAMPLLDRQPGVLLGIGADALSFQTQARDWSVPVDSISMLEKSAGSRSHAGIGALIGLGVGLLIPLAATGGDLGSSSCQADTGGNLCGAVILLGGVGGGVAGLLLGALIRTEKWEPVERPYR